MTKFWTRLTAAERQAYLDGSFRRRWRRGDPLFHQGDDPGLVALLHTGHVKVCAHTPDGDDVVLAICGPGTLIKTLSGWRRQGWIRTGRRSVTILDPAALRHAGPPAAR